MHKPRACTESSMEYPSPPSCTPCPTPGASSPPSDDQKQQQPRGVNFAATPISPEDSSSPASDVRYVLSGQPTGWAAIAETVRAYDEETVKDMKEDINSLLVFAGLFSVVLAVFLVESYSKLSPDTSSQMLEVMQQQVALQMVSYNVANGIIDSTSHPPMSIVNTSSQPFEPSATDIRINVLWFSSLIFSLATASFGLLVKQWLREYLVVDKMSPQARLRIRRFRYPELVKWSVFEIAAMLPLLQQTALALFFIGLCYFTASVHESVGYISLPLVAAWAFCVSAAILLPLFFPRCPYKTTLLKHLLWSIHMYFANTLLEITRRLCTWHSGSPYESIRDYAFRWTMRLLLLLDGHINKIDEQIAVSAEYADLDILVDVDAFQSDDEVLGSTILESLQQIQPEWTNVVNFILRVLQHRVQREDMTGRHIKPGPLDLLILTRAGRAAVINILSHFSTSAISQYVQSDSAITRWRRSKETMLAFYIFFSPSRYTLPPSGVKVLQEVLRYKGDELIRLLAHECPRPTSPVEDKFFLLVFGLLNVLEDLDMDLTSSLCYLEIIFGVRFEDARTGHVDARFPDGPFAIQGDLEAWPWRQVISSEAGIYAAQYMIFAVRRALRHMKRATSKALVRPGAPAAVALQPPPNRLVDGFVGLWHMSFIGRIEEFSYSLQLRFRAAIEECFAMKESTLALLEAFGHITPGNVIHIQTKWRAVPCGPWLLLEDTRGKLENFVDSANDLLGIRIARAEDSTSSSSPVTTIHILLICYIALQMVELPDALQYADQWKTLFKVLTCLGNKSIGITPSGSVATSLAGDFNVSKPPRPSPVPITVQPTQFPGVTLEQAQELTALCLQAVQRHDTHVLASRPGDKISQSMSMLELGNAYEEWLSLFKIEDSVVEDEFVEMLGRIFRPTGLDVPNDDDGLRYFRLKRLGILKSNLGSVKEDEDAAIADTPGRDTLINGEQNDDDSSISDIYDEIKDQIRPHT